MPHSKQRGALRVLLPTVIGLSQPLQCIIFVRRVAVVRVISSHPHSLHTCYLLGNGTPIGILPLGIQESASEVPPSDGCADLPGILILFYAGAGSGRRA